MSTQHTTGRLEVVNDTGEWAAEYDEEGSTCSVGLVTESGSMVALAVAYSPNIFADPDPTANARRLAACWNLLDGVPTEKIEESTDYGSSWGQCGLELWAMTAQRNELMEALETLQSAVLSLGIDATAKALAKAQAALSNTEGTTP